MKNDNEVRTYMALRKKGKTQSQAALKVGIGERTARKYEQAALLPSQLKKDRTYRTRSNPFEEDWPWIKEQLERDPALQATTLFAILRQKRPEYYQDIQVRTLQRHIATWRALSGPEQEVIFQQIHQPAHMAQSDFTHMSDLNITLAGQHFPHLLYHFVLVYSGFETVMVCPSESFEALAEGLEQGLWSAGGSPQQHRTDHLSAAVKHHQSENKATPEDFTLRYQALMQHYGIEASTNNLGVSHENGSVEQSHFRFKDAVDQDLRLRGTRDFSSQGEYEKYLRNLAHKRNQSKIRQERLLTEREQLRPLPPRQLDPVKEVWVSVSRFSTVQILSRTYSVPSRLIGNRLKVRVRAATVEGYLGSSHVFSYPRLVGASPPVTINYRHIIWSLVRKPAAFSGYRYREELFPSTIFRKAYDRLLQSHAQPLEADRHYLRLLHLAATISEEEVSLALSLLLEEGEVPRWEVVQELVSPAALLVGPAQNGEGVSSTCRERLSQYDGLLNPSEVEVAEVVAEVNDNYNDNYHLGLVEGLAAGSDSVSGVAKSYDRLLNPEIVEMPLNAESQNPYLAYVVDLPLPAATASG
jgi:hypothetical protein